VTDPLPQLRSLLADEEFERGDLLTTSVILAAAGRLDRGWLRLSDGAKLPDGLLNDLGSAWSDGTGGRHGFQVQRQRFPIGSRGGAEFVDMAVEFGWRSRPDSRPVREVAALVPRYREFVTGDANLREGFYPTLRNPAVEDYVAWYDRWKMTVLAVHLRLAGWREGS
jgi:hypothetical protein